LVAINKILGDTRPEILRLYQPLIEFSKHIALNSPKLPAEKVAKVVGKVLHARKPKGRYIIGADARLFKLVRHVPCLVRDWIILKIIPNYGHKN
jgi:hypothetical protein